MQQQQALQAYAQQNKGTLVPGQTISVNKYTVQVERYLSQGGFSHVYLVRTPTPVYNTTHHVLKRIGVPNEAMLAEVKKEVDIMRILKGHPNVVHLIDAAWHKMANGMYEVFILMEFCPGGGIIDMMNRRLRERLTEAEILQIFVDVCEGVAAMHNLRPALLHRDLKVENILQASNNVFKLCDFGSATPVAPRPPSTTAEIRALEADLNRHTTLQYRAPEMVDPYLRRSVDEKSDVWALGVLLYKLCYYTTPFEEHGPLAILNVQYRIPPYPVYSSQMNTLIASMLREHGTQRPTIFELLAQVHAIRGTKSRFVYDIPPPQPLSPRALQLPSTNPLDNLVSYRRAPATDATQQVQPAQPQDIGTGIQARDRVLEAIAPMRRGRPYHSQQQNDTTPSSTSRPPSPPKLPRKPDASFGAEEDKAWKELKSSSAVLAAGGIRAHKSGSITASVWRPKISAPPLDDTWSVETRASKAISDEVPSPGVTAFGDNFGEKLWSAFDGTKAGGATPATGVGPSSSTGKERISKLAPPPEGSRTTRLTITKSKDAFDGLGLTPSSAPTPTLGEARKLRTGLAVVNGNNRAAITPSPSIAAAKPSPAPIKPMPSPRPPAQLTTTHASWRSSPSVQPPASTPPKHPQMGEFSAEARFPSVEELDATFGVSAPSWQLESSERHKEREKVVNLSEPSFAPSSSLQPTSQRAVLSTTLGLRSEHVTGVAMRDSEKDKIQRSVGLENGIGANTSSPKPASYRPLPRPSLSRRHRSSITVKATPQAQLIDDIGTQDITTPGPALRKPKDWLTGDVDALISPIKDGSFAQAQASNLPATPVLREFTNKRSSFIEENTTNLQSPQEAVAAQQPPHRVTTPPSPSKMHTRGTSVRERKQSVPLTPKKPRELPVVAPKPVIAALALKPDLESRQGVTSQPLKRPPQDDSDRRKAFPISESPKATKMQDSSSDGEQGPEDAVGFAPGKLVEKTGSSRRRKTRGRQSSVHDLVDLWGGGVVQTKERPKDSVHSPAVAAFNEPTRDFAVKLQKSRSIAVSSMAKQRPASPRMQSQPSEPNHSQRRSPSRSPMRPFPQTPGANTPSSGNAPVSSSRGRPQSMLAFPVAKSTSDGKMDAPSTPTGLSVPEDNPRKHGARRTSITDMVQRFEAIGGKARGLGAGSPVIVPKLAGLKMPTSSTGNGRAVDVTGTSPSSPLVSRFTASRVTASAFEESSPGLDPGKPRPSAIDLARAALANQDQSKADMNIRNPVAGLPTGTPSRFMPGSSVGRTGPLDGLSASLSFSPPKPATPLEEPRSPSPDKPFQGVGKLIDQWQRKTEVDSPRAPIPRRGGFTPKRAGLVYEEVGKDS
ncbi:hypothetical protein DEU56DRAFT_976352 [Suillus clintonianus]|uniref:uncharacterized protein n=1 Tax=Suillus clintonianus TaxID=1904413 RepID=UPI001B868026|nr:uncharacterized protein DEU56DRAFT_976352 [Suillus clintonianus]KAG2154569.1 hypothetical protein DEU56DRAFT_976352 [Suillus clintonianus]